MPWVRSGSAAAVARGWARLIGPAQLAILIALPVAWTATLFTARIPWLWRQDVSIASGLVDLWAIDRLLFAVVLVFSVIAPAAKAALGLWLWYRVPLGDQGSWPSRLAILGKLAMTEIFLLAVAIVGFKGVGLGQVETRWGMWWLTGVVVAGLGIGVAMGRCKTPPAAESRF